MEGNMSDLSQTSSEEQIKKQEEFFKKAQKGTLKYLLDKGGSLKMGELHEYSLNKYLVQHQRFSQMMEIFVDGGLVHFDWETQVVSLTDTGKEFIQSA